MVQIHYTCVVIGEDWEGQLAPFNEALEAEPYKAYWDSKELEQWERILSESTGQRRKEGSDPLSNETETFTYPPEQVLPEDWSLEDMRRVYLARYHNGDDGPYEDEPEDERLFLDDGGIYRWSTYNQRSKWDWYEMGGRWMGYFRLKPGTNGKLGSPGLDTEGPREDVDQARKGDIDIDGMRDTAGSNAGEIWDRVNAVIKDLPVAHGWQEHFIGLVKLAEAGEGEPYSIEQARTDYHAQERVVALKEWNETLPDNEKVMGFFGPGVEDFQVDRDEYVQRVRDAVLAPYAYLRGGVWHAPGEMGWFSSSDTDAERRAFQREFNEILDQLPDDALLTLVDLHI